MSRSSAKELFGEFSWPTKIRIEGADHVSTMDFGPAVSDALWKFVDDLEILIDVDGTDSYPRSDPRYGKKRLVINLMTKDRHAEWAQDPFCHITLEEMIRRGIMDSLSFGGTKEEAREYRLAAAVELENLAKRLRKR